MSYSEECMTTIKKLAAIRQALEKYHFSIHVLKEQIAELDQAGVCTGVVHWRKGNGKDKMYANHGIDRGCPIHGQPRPGRRLRVYIGTDSMAQDYVKEAIEHYDQKQTVKAKIHHIEIRRSRVEGAVTVAWRHATGSQRWE